MLHLHPRGLVSNPQQKLKGLNLDYYRVLFQILLHTTVSLVVEDSEQHSVMLSVLIKLSKYLQQSKDHLSLHQKFSCSYTIILHFTKKKCVVKLLKFYCF